jgi:hypothetical protein
VKNSSHFAPTKRFSQSQASTAWITWLTTQMMTRTRTGSQTSKKSQAKHDDTDDDGLPSGGEIYVYNTDPLKEDTYDDEYLRYFAMAPIHWIQTRMITEFLTAKRCLLRPQ